MNSLNRYFAYISETLSSSWTKESRKRALFHWASEKERQQDKTSSLKVVWGGREGPEKALFVDHSLHPVAAELAGARLMRLLGIGTSNIEFITGEEAQKCDPKKYLIKTIVGSRLKISFGLENAQQMVVTSEKILGAVPLFYLVEFYDIKPDFPTVPGYSTAWARADYHLNAMERMRIAIFLGKDQVPEAREFYADFQPPSDWAPIREAIAWNSDPMLRIHAARLFLGATTAHVSNLLVDNKANLYTIDTEYCLATTSEDLDRLFENIVPHTRAFYALSPVAELREFEVAELFDELPEVGWPLGSKEKTVEHYTKRLRKWKGLFETLSRS